MNIHHIFNIFKKTGFFRAVANLVFIVVLFCPAWNNFFNSAWNFGGGAANANTIYIWYDEDGKKHATSTPPPKKAEGVQSYSLEAYQRGDAPFILSEEEFDEPGQPLADDPGVDERAFAPAMEEDETSTDDRAKESGALKVDVQGDKVFVPVTILGEPTYTGSSESGVTLSLLMDTGASTTVIYKNAAQRAGILPSGSATAHLADGSLVQAETAVLEKLIVGDFVHKNLRVFLIDSARESEIFGGLLGMDVLKRMTFVMDFDNEMLRFP